MARRKNTAEAFEILLQIAEEKKKKALDDARAEGPRDPQRGPQPASQQVGKGPGEAAVLWKETEGGLGEKSPASRSASTRASINETASLSRRAVKRAPVKTWQEPLLGSRASPLAGGSRSRSLPQSPFNRSPFNQSSGPPDAQKRPHPQNLGHQNLGPERIEPERIERERIERQKTEPSREAAARGRGDR
jgi:hypothetical protein